MAVNDAGHRADFPLAGWFFGRLAGVIRASGDIHSHKHVLLGRFASVKRPLARMTCAKVRGPLPKPGGPGQGLAGNLFGVMPDRFAPVLAEVAPLSARFHAAGHAIYLVGGAVRDLLLGNVESVDLDLTTPARPDEIKRLVKGWADDVWAQGEKFGTIGCRKDGVTYEITTHRADSYEADTRKPTVTFGDRIEDDLARRDFTINAMALRLGDTPELIDPYGGIADLAAKVLRTPLSPEISFTDDPLRMLRAARFIPRFGLTPDPALVAAVKEMAARLEIVSAERVRDELDKLMLLPRPGDGLWFLVDNGLADQFLPELPAMRLEQDPIHRHKDVLAHSIAVVENVQPDAKPVFDFRLTRLAALFHDVGKPKTRSYRKGTGVSFHHHDVVGARMTKDRMSALKYSSADIDAVSELVDLHLRFHTYKMGWTDAAVRRYVRDAGPLLTELNVLTRCDCTTRNAKKAAMLSGRMDELEVRIAELSEAEELASIRPEMDGAAVMAHLGIAPGRAIGQALAFLLEIRMEEGIIGDAAIRARLDAWWASQSS